MRLRAFVPALVTTALVTAACVSCAACSGPGSPSQDDAGVDSSSTDPPVDAGADVTTTDGDAKASRAGMGATVYPGGVTFRVWAPHATQVFVTGSFAEGDATGKELALEGGGIFAADVPMARAGDTYSFTMHRSIDTAIRADPRARRMTASSGKSVVVDPSTYAWSATPFTPPSIDEQVIYELHIGTFAATDAATAPGTFTTAIEKLDRLASLGVNMIEVLPTAQFPGDYSWGYNPAFPFAPAAVYGTPDDMKRFVDEAHRRGIGVIVDVVHNHYTKRDQSMWCFDLECLGPTNGGVYFYTDARRDTGWGPRPDFSRPEVRDFIVDATTILFDEYRIDGLRWDSVVNIRRIGGTANADGWSLLRRANDVAHGGKLARTIIAEDLQNDESITRKTTASGAGFDAQWDPSFFYPMKAAIVATNDADRNMTSVRDAIAHSYNASATQRVVFTENHDQVSTQNGPQNKRIPELITPGGTSFEARRRSTLGATILLTSPGVPMLFQGQEMLENQEFAFNCKVGVDWSKTVTHAGIVELYRDLIHLRRDTAKTTRGLRGNNVSVFHVNDGGKVIAFRRWDKGGVGDDVIVVANFSAKTFTAYDLGFPAAGTWKVRFSGDSKAYGDDYLGGGEKDVIAVVGARDGWAWRGVLELPPYSAIILSQ